MKSLDFLVFLKVVGGSAFDFDVGEIGAFEVGERQKDMEIWLHVAIVLWISG